MSALERAQELLEEGRHAAALAALPKRASPERDFLAAEAWRAQGFFGRAEALYGRALRSRPDRRLALDCLLGLTRIARSLGRVPEGRRLLSRAARLARGGEREALELEGALLDRAAGLYPRSLARLGRLLSKARKEKDRGAEAFLLWAIGGARRFAGDLNGARRDFLDSLKAARRARDASGQVYALFGLAGASRILGRVADSRRLYEEAGRRLRGSDDVFGRAYAYCGLANALRQLGRWRQAERRYGLSRGLYASLGDRVDLAYVDWGLGQVYFKTGRLARAEAATRLALAGFASGDEQRGLALSRLALAWILHARGRTAEAERLFDLGVREGRKASLHAHLETFT